jgi:4-hydroxy-tetrahydrodipicolinate reductase
MPLSNQGRTAVINAVVAGAAGRMGKRLVALLHESPEFKVAGAFERPGHPQVGQDAGAVAGVGPLGVAISDTAGACLRGAQVLLDFTAPAATMQNLDAASRAGVAMVIGTTGIGEADLRRFPEFCTTIPCVRSPSMSVAVNAVFGSLAQLARTLGDDYDVEIVEAHHHFKKDAPSGTAERMAEIVAHALGRDLKTVGVYGRHGMIGERGPKEIGVHAIRAGDIVGEHTVLFGGVGERVEVTVRSQSRDSYAQGALRAAAWVVGKRPGLYDMADVLGLR